MWMKGREKNDESADGAQGGGSRYLPRLGLPKRRRGRRREPQVVSRPHRDQEELVRPAPAGTSLQDLTHRYNYVCKSVPVSQHLQARSASSEAFKVEYVMWGDTACTSSRRVGRSPTPTPPDGWRRGCADTLGATPLRLAEVSGPTPPTFWRVLGVGRWRSHGRRGYTKPTGRPTPREPPPRCRESLPTHPPDGTSPATRSASLPSRRLAGMNAPPTRRRSSSPEPGRGTV